MLKAIALSLPYPQSPLFLAVDSLHNSMRELGVLLFGTKRRADITLTVAVMMMVLGSLMQSPLAAGLSICAG